MIAKFKLELERRITEVMNTLKDNLINKTYAPLDEIRLDQGRLQALRDLLEILDDVEAEILKGE